MSDTLIAVIIGIVEGLTEFIPVSSTGHMILVGNLIGYNDAAASVFEVFIQNFITRFAICTLFKFKKNIINN